ncbi:MAG: 16S rRNA (cytosine(967)-C(5))-methyltransferase RsmB, partial [Terriglobales bacterium]
DAALDILLRVEQGGFASELLHSERLDKLSTQNRGLATELVMGVLRWRSRLDEGIASVSSQKLAKLDAEVLESLRMAAYQIGFLARVPAHAAVNDAVELVRRKKKRSAAPFVNAVLRKLIEKKGVLEPVLAPGPKTIPELPILYAHPLWMVERWAVRYGLEAADRICDYNQKVPPTALRFRDPAAEQELIAADIVLAPGRLLESARIVVNGDVTKTRAFAEGRVQIQDEGSQLVAMLVGRGERLLDCCAAPGGKTAILADRNPQSEVVATELHEHRARELRARLSGRSNVVVIAADATSLEIAGEFDRVLADVPCSGTGTLARNPEIKWRLTVGDLSDLHARQVAILRAALGKLRPGGRLVYSTCSLEPEENEEVVHEAGARVLPVRQELEALRREGTLITGDYEAITDGPFLRILPGAFGTDGFFAAQLVSE